MFRREDYVNLDTSDTVDKIKDSELKEFVIANQILTEDITDPEYFKRYNMFPDKYVSKALNDYGTSTYTDINTIMRTIKRGDPIDNKIEFYINNLTKSMKLVSRFRLNKKFVVWRGIKPPSTSQYYSELMDLKNKRFLNNDSFLSTSYDKSSALEFSECCLFKIYIDPAQDLEYVFMDLIGEREFLFEHGTYFEYIDEYEEFFEYDNSRRKIFEVFLKKKQVIEEYRPVSAKVMDEKEFYESVINSIPEVITEEMIRDEKDLFDNLEDNQDSQFKFFIKSFKSRYPNNYKTLDSRLEDIQRSVYDYVRKIFDKL
jgi:hypothetical protein